jgi:NAD(P)-dependent dehydrogenase (short-subunit alcohol dehydrogenase family)
VTHQPSSNTPPRRCAIVTGGNGGIGRATVLTLARLGWEVAFSYLVHADEAEETQRLASDLGVAVVRSYKADFGNLDAARAVITRMIHDLGRIDLLVNNAAVNTRGSFLDMTTEAWERTLAVNCSAPFVCSQVAAAAMVQQAHGCIVNVSSVVAVAPLEFASAYCASKAALDMLTRVSALELAQHGVRVVGIAPGHTRTRMNYGHEWNSSDPDAPALPIIPLGRSAWPNEVARLVGFVADEPGYMTGTTLAIDGGLSLVSGPNFLQRLTGLPPAHG